MNTDIVDGNLFEAAREQALLTVRVIEKLLNLSSLADAAECLADEALDATDLADLYRYIATKGREPKELTQTIVKALESRWRDETAAALAVEFAPTGLAVGSFLPLANGLMQTCRATAQIGFWPAPFAVAALVAQSTGFTMHGEDWRKVLWCKGGRLHRDPAAGPAVHLSEPRGDRFEYWVDGNLDRNWREGPAVIDTNLADRGIYHEAYWTRGQQHRPSAEGPAVYEIDGENRERCYAYMENGREVAGPGGWMVRYYDKEADTFCEAYLQDGELHRDWREGPAVIARSASGQYVERKYFDGGKLHRPVNDGPAIEGESKDGIVVRVYSENDLRHRPWQDGPAEWVELGNGGYWETYMERGEEHRPADQGPAHTYCDRQSGALITRYAEHGRKHRDPSAGPAVSECWGGGTAHEEFWLNGEKVSGR